MVETNNIQKPKESLESANSMEERKVSDADFPSKLKEHVEQKASSMSKLLPDHDEVIDLISEKIKKVDFGSRAGNIDDDKLKRKHYLIIAVEEILSKAKQSGFGICRRNESIYIYNGAYWKLIEPNQVKVFLSKAVEKMGLDKFEARFYRFIDELFKQFLTTSTEAVIKKADSVLVNLMNGTLEVIDGKARLREFKREDFLTYQLKFRYDRTAKAPRFYEYLNHILPDVASQKVLSEFVGNVFIKNDVLKLEKALLLYGDGANGKSVFFDVVRAILGQENLVSYSLQSLTNETGYSRAKLAGKLVNYTSEISTRMNTTIFKQLVSGEPVEARSPYGQPFMLTDYPKLMFNVNELPRDVEHNYAFYRRFLIIPFNVKIAPEKQDKEIANKIIKEELAGVLNWILEGLNRLLIQKEFSECEASEIAIENYKTESDSVRMFLHEYGYKESPYSYTKAPELYQEYRTFCQEDGYIPVAKSRFYKRIKTIGITFERKNSGNVVYVQKS